MSNNGTKIWVNPATEKGVSISDIRKVLRSKHKDLGQLCCLEKVNKWAKYKPVRYGRVAVQNRDMTKPNYLADWWRDYQGHCGLDIPVFGGGSFGNGFTNPSTLMHYLMNNNEFWNRLLPDGASFPYRAGDFDGYNHKAICPVGGLDERLFLEVPEGAPAGTSEMNLNVSFETNAVEDDNLSLADIAINGVSLANWYLGVLLYNDRGSWFKACVSTQRMGDGTINFVVPFLRAEAGTYNAAFFAADKPYSPTENATVVTIPMEMKKRKITIVDPSTMYEVFAVASWTDSINVHVILTCSNQNSSDYTFSTVVAVYRRNAYEDELASQSVTISQKVSRYSTYTTEFDIRLINDRRDDYEYYIYAKDRNSAATESDIEETGDFEE